MSKFFTVLMLCTAVVRVFSAVLPSEKSPHEFLLYYNLREDIGETEHVIAEHPEIAEKSCKRAEKEAAKIFQ